MLVSEGQSMDQAVKAVNESSYATSHDISLDETFTLETSIVSVAKNFPGISQLFQEKEIDELGSENVVRATDALSQNSKVLGNYWSSINSGQQSLLVYTVILGFLAVLMELFIAPQFSEIYMSFGAELPGLTQIMLTNSTVLFTMLFLVVSLNVLILELFRQGEIAAKKMSLLPTWTLKIPLFSKHLQMLNHCIILSLLHFVATAQMMSELELKKLDTLVTGKKGKSWLQDITEKLLLAKEFQLEKPLIEKDMESMLERFSSQGAESIKILLLLVTIIVFGFIGALVVAMYLPIFQLGAIV